MRAPSTRIQHHVGCADIRAVHATSITPTKCHDPKWPDDTDDLSAANQNADRW